MADGDDTADANGDAIADADGNTLACPCKCDADCNYMQAYECDTGVPSGMWLATADVHGNIAKTGGISDPDGRKCWEFRDCSATLPDGATLLTGIKGWFAACNSCKCYECYSAPEGKPASLTITVTQDDCDCCIQLGSSGGVFINERRKIQGSAAGTFTIPLVSHTCGAIGEITVPGPTVTSWNVEPYPFDDGPCGTGLAVIDPSCCTAPEGTPVNYVSSDLVIRVLLDCDVFGGDNPGACVVEAFTHDGCLVWSFSLPGCPFDADSEDDLIFTAEFDAGLGCNDGFGFSSCNSCGKNASAVGAFSWAA